MKAPRLLRPANAAILVLVVLLCGSATLAYPIIVTEYPIPIPNSAPNGITAGPDGNVWFTGAAGTNSRIGKITPDGAVTLFTISPFFPEGNEVWGITTGPDGNLWFTSPYTCFHKPPCPPPGPDKIGRITTA